MNTSENVPLARYTTLRIGGPARYFVEVASENELREALAFARSKNLPIFILGGGSNVLFADRGFDGVVIRPMIMGREIVEETDNYVKIKIGAGEVLDKVIEWTVGNSWWGLENLSFIPGLTGALAIQNVGAYGQEASEVIESVEVLDRSSYELRIMTHEECDFTYRHSRFNTYDKNKYVILKICLKLPKQGAPNLAYKDLQEYFDGKATSQTDVRKAVISIRTKKGQDQNEFWTAGSFFSNFKLTHVEFENLVKKVGNNKEGELRELVKKVSAPSDGGKIKVPAAWILDRLLNLKGFQVGGAKLSDRQVLNLINTGGATARDCIELFEKVRELVREKTGLVLVNEPEFVGF